MRDRTFFFGAAERKDQQTPADNNIRPENAAILGLPSEDVGPLPAYHPGRPSPWGRSRTISARITRCRRHSSSRRTRSTTLIFQSFTTRGRGLRITPTDWSAQVQWQGITRNGHMAARSARVVSSRATTRLIRGGQGLFAPGSKRTAARARRAQRSTSAAWPTSAAGASRTAVCTGPMQVDLLLHDGQEPSQPEVRRRTRSAWASTTRYGGRKSGRYSFRNLAGYRTGRYRTYTQRFGEPLIARNRTCCRGRRRTRGRRAIASTLNYGLRYDVERLSKYHGRKLGATLTTSGLASRCRTT